jgi:RNA polymerase subunit RPABC4/transcription elongation factor Spt4
MNERSHFGREFAIIPQVARVLAVVVFAIVQICLLVLVPHYVDAKDVPPMPALIAISLLGGAIMVVVVLMIGYVNADSKRRGMNSLLWTLLVIFVPKALGFLAYFLLRKPLMMPCPNCGTTVGKDFRFCPKCGYAVTPMCPHCGQSVSRDYLVCPYCGKSVAQAATPPPAMPPLTT